MMNLLEHCRRRPRCDRACMACISEAREDEGMTTKHQIQEIPPEARLAATEAHLRTGGCIVSTVLAALNAWPDVSVAPPDSWVRCRRTSPTIILPLPQKEPRT